MKENILHNFCFQELQDGTGIDYACSSWKLLPIKVGLSPFLLMGNMKTALFSILFDDTMTYTKMMT